MNKEISKRLNEALEALNLKPADVARDLNKSKGNISSLLKGDVKPSADFLALLKEKYNINTNWVLTGEGSMFVNVSDEESKIARSLGLDSLDFLTGYIDRAKKGDANAMPEMVGFINALIGRKK